MSKKTVRESEDEAGLHTRNAAGEVTPEQTGEQMQQGNANLDSKKEANQVMSEEDQAGQVPKSPTAEDMKGTSTDPVSYSNPAFDASIDADKIDLPKDQQDKEIVHTLKPTNFYKKGDEITYMGQKFVATYDGHGDLPPSMWKPAE